MQNLYLVLLVEDGGIKFMRKFIILVISIALLLAACQKDSVDKTYSIEDNTTFSDNSTVNDNYVGSESKISDESIASSDDETPEGYTDITTQLFNVLDDDPGSYEILYADSTVLVFLNTKYTVSDMGYPFIESYTYTLKSVEPNSITLISEKTIEDIFGFPTVKGNKILLFESDNVSVFDLQLNIITEIPVPESVKQGIESADIVPYNEVGSGYNPRDYRPKYDISSDFTHFIYTNDYGLFRYSTLDNTTEELLEFSPASYFLGAPYYEDNFYAPSFSPDEKSIHGLSVSQPKAGAHFSFAATFDLESGKLTMSFPYEQEMLDFYINSRLPYAPLKHVTAIRDGLAIYCISKHSYPWMPDKFYLGAYVDVESLKEVLTQEYLAQNN